MLGMVVEVKMPCKGHLDWHFDKDGGDCRAEDVADAVHSG